MRPDTTTLQTAEKRHANAKAVLDLRLENGEDTTEARSQLARAEGELADAQAREDERQAEARSMGDEIPDDYTGAGGFRYGRGATSPGASWS